MSIVIFSDPIHSGKTTRLWHWCDQQQYVAGILMPDINGLRHIMDVPSKASFIIQCIDPENSNNMLVSIGRYHFYANGFTKANSILLKHASMQYNWLVIDEVGKLELDGKGLYPAVSGIINSHSYTNLLLVVREGLYEPVIDFFKIAEHRVVHQLDDLV